MWKNAQIERIAIDVDHPLGVLVRSVVGLDHALDKALTEEIFTDEFID